MVHPVEELSQIQTYTIIITFVCIVLNFMQYIVRSAVRMKAETIVTELRFIERNQYLADRLLDKAVYNSRYFQWSDTGSDAYH